MGDKAKLFEPYRALGLYSSHIPHCTRYHQKHQEHYVFVAVGKVFHTYNCSKLKLTQVSNAHPEDISCIAADRFLVYTGCGNTVRAFQHNRQVKYTYEGHKDEVHLILPFSEHLITVDISGAVKIWHINSQELYLDMEFDNKSFQITSILHPSTYVNKILFGSSQGTLQLWNIRKNVMLYTFKDVTDTSSVVCMAQSPAVDVIAIGRSSGSVVIVNIKLDREIMRFVQNEDPIVGIAFRLDGPPTMVTGGEIKISVWDLEEKRLLSVMERVHSDKIAGMTFLPGQPALLTNSADNSVKMWAFDQSDGSGRLLRYRAGHSLPPTKIRFHDETNIISVAYDSTMRIFSLENEHLVKSMGQASTNRAMARRAAAHLDKRKLPPIVDFSSSTARQREWDNIIAFHHKTAIATTWNFHRCKMGTYKLLHERFRNLRTTAKDKNKEKKVGVYVTAVTSTQCGNFCIVGYNTGHVDIFNMQSGLHRGTFVDADLTSAHTRQICGIAVNLLNQVVVTAGSDNSLKFWRFKTKKLIEKIEIESKPSMLSLQGENSLVAVALDDFSILVYDLDTRNLARRLTGFRGNITDMTWSADGRWLVAASMDCTIRTFELSSSSLIDCFLVDTPAVTVALSVNADVLATCHVDDLGVFLWYNSSIYGRVSLAPLPLDYHPTNVVELPASEATDGDVAESECQTSKEVTQDNDDAHLAKPLDETLVTTSGLPSTKWAHLVSLDIIKKRNKPKQPVKQPKLAPFFIPTVAGLTPSFDIGGEEKDSKIVKPMSLMPLSNFASSLLDQESTSNQLTAMNKLKEMGPSAIDAEIRGLASECGGSLEVMSGFLKLILSTLKSRKDFEFAESLLALFMKVHAGDIASDPILVELLEEIEIEHKTCWDSLRKDIDQSICLLNHIKAVNSHA